MTTHLWKVVVACLAVFSGCSKPVSSVSQADRVLVLQNADSPASKQIAEHYMSKRGVKNMLEVHCPDSSVSAANESLPYETFKQTIEAPLKEYLTKNPQIDFIVLTKGIPIRLTGATIGINNTQPSLDSYIAALDYSARPQSLKVVIDESGYKGNCFVNNFFNANEPFSHAKHGGYLVTRLDGYTVESALALVDSSVASDGKKDFGGSIFLDANASAEPADIAKVPQLPIKDGKTNMEMISGLAVKDWNADLLAAAENLKNSRVVHELESSPKFVGGKQSLIGYASWGSNDGKFDETGYKAIRFVPGGIAETAVSTSGRTFLKTSGGQSLIADLIDCKVTGVKGYCDEPFLPAIASPTILFDRYTKGWTLAESFYAASRFVGWEDIVIGDPLARPFAK